MKIAITGATGYLGRCITEAFRRQGHTVLCLSRKPCDEPWITYSLDDDPLQLPWNDVDVLIHTAYDFTARGWQEILEKNVKPSVALFQAAVRGHVENLIFISSMSSFEGCRSNYGRAKWMIEKEVLNLGATVIRPGLVWGEQAGGIMGTLEKAVAMLPIIPFPSGGNSTMQFLIHKLDLSDALIAFSQCPPPPHRAVQSLAHPTPFSLRGILQNIANRSCQSRIYLPLPWRSVMAGLKAAEILNVRFPFRSDSLLGFIQGNPNPRIDAPPATITFRPFD